ncbi:MAG: DEAD/DEAH box helicase [Ignavibacteriales bacterium]|nr:DEAD/DEAH box helicase [Ignavibacteriales bacterium]
MSKEVLQLVRDIQKDPQLIEVGARNNPVESVTQHFYSCPSQSKTRLLLHVIEAEKMDCVLVFSRTKHGADKIAKQLLRKGLKCAALHSNKTQSQRQRSLADFKNGVITVLIATDIAARGIDVEGISHVINFDTPRFAEDYVHRIGRTGRASAKGDSLTFVSNDEREFVHKIGKFIGKRTDAKPYAGFDYSAPSPGPEGDSDRKDDGNRRHHAGSHRTERSESSSHRTERSESGSHRPESGSHRPERPESGGRWKKKRFGAAGRKNVQRQSKSHT